MLKALNFGGAPALVTGGSAGIGKAIAETLADLGARVIIVARREEALREVQAGIRSRGGQCEMFTADVSREDDVERLAKWVEETFGAVKALVNNAGDNFRTPIAQLSPAKWHELIAVNLDSVFLMCRAFIPLLLKAEQPSIVNVSSSFGIVGNAETPAYCAAKGAVINLTRQLAIDYGPQGLRVNTLCPGPTLSPRILGYIEKANGDPRGKITNVALNRRAECDEIGDVAAFLASDAASYIHGATIVADGGQTII